MFIVGVALHMRFVDNKTKVENQQTYPLNISCPGNIHPLTPSNTYNDVSGDIRLMTSVRDECFDLQDWNLATDP